MGLRDDYLDMEDGNWVKAASEFAKDLTRDESALEPFKVGYSRTNAILSAGEMFPEVTEEEIRDCNHWSST